MEKKSKTVEMKKSQEKNGEKLAYEQLEQVAGNLNQQCQQLSIQLRNAQNVINEFNEIGMLLDVLGKAEYFSDAFVTRCAQKIEEIISKALDNSEKAEKEQSK